MSSILQTDKATGDDLITRGLYTYRERLASLLEPAHLGEFVAIEPESARYFLGETASEALISARAAMPEALFYLTRVGRETAHTVGGHASRIR